MKGGFGEATTETRAGGHFAGAVRGGGGEEGKRLYVQASGICAGAGVQGGMGDSAAEKQAGLQWPSCKSTNRSTTKCSCTVGGLHMGFWYQWPQP